VSFFEGLPQRGGAKTKRKGNWGISPKEMSLMARNELETIYHVIIGRLYV
jgi:hypothetical protein